MKKSLVHYSNRNAKNRDGKDTGKSVNLHQPFSQILLLIWFVSSFEPSILIIAFFKGSRVELRASFTAIVAAHTLHTKPAKACRKTMTKLKINNSVLLLNCKEKRSTFLLLSVTTLALNFSLGFAGLRKCYSSPSFPNTY